MSARTDFPYLPSYPSYPPVPIPPLQNYSPCSTPSDMSDSSGVVIPRNQSSPISTVTSANFLAAFGYSRATGTSSESAESSRKNGPGNAVEVTQPARKSTPIVDSASSHPSTTRNIPVNSPLLDSTPPPRVSPLVETPFASEVPLPWAWKVHQGIIDPAESFVPGRFGTPDSTLLNHNLYDINPMSTRTTSSNITRTPSPVPPSTCGLRDTPLFSRTPSPHPPPSTSERLSPPEVFHEWPGVAIPDPLSPQPAVIVPSIAPSDCQNVHAPPAPRHVRIETETQSSNQSSTSRWSQLAPPHPIAIPGPSVGFRPVPMPGTSSTVYEPPRPIPMPGLRTPARPPQQMPWSSTRTAPFNMSGVTPDYSYGYLPGYVSPDSKSKTFYFEDGNIEINVQGKYYRVHKFFLDSNSEIFKNDMYGVFYGYPLSFSNIIPGDFDQLLSIFYPTDYTKKKTVEEWTSVLRVSKELKMDKIRNLALHKIAKKASAVDKIALSKEFDFIDKEWLIGAYTELATRTTPIGLEEGKKIGIEGLTAIQQLKYELMNELNKYLDMEKMEKLLENMKIVT